MIQSHLKSGCKQWAIHSTACSYNHTTHFFCCFAMLAFLARADSFACSLGTMKYLFQFSTCFESLWRGGNRRGRRRRRRGKLWLKMSEEGSPGDKRGHKTSRSLRGRRPKTSTAPLELRSAHSRSKLYVTNAFNSQRYMDK